MAIRIIVGYEVHNNRTGARKLYAANKARVARNYAERINMAHGSHIAGASPVFCCPTAECACGKADAQVQS